MDEPTRPSDTAARLQEAVVSGELPVVYANGFSLGLTNADVVIVLMRNARPAQVVNMSYTLAKTLHTKLARVVEDFEASAGRNLLTTDDVDAAIKKGETTP